MMFDASPVTYARHLTEYISDPTTVRVRVLEYFGKAPPLETIQYFRSEVERLNARQWNTYQTPKYDDDFTGIAPKPVAKVVKIVKPVERKLWPSWYIPPSQIRAGVAARLINAVAHRLCITPAEIRGDGRSADLVDARSVVATVLRARGWSYPMIGVQLGGKDHSTVINAVKRLPRRIRAFPDLQEVLDESMREFSL